MDTFIEVYRSIPIAPRRQVAGHEVLQRIHQSRHEIDAPREPIADVDGAAPTNLLAFVSLARVVAGEAGVADVLALGSALLADVMPGSTGAWFLPDAAQGSARRGRRVRPGGGVASRACRSRSASG